MRRALTILIVVVGIAALAIIGFYWGMQRQLIYFPSGEVPEPVEVGLPQAEKVTFATEDGLTLHGWFVPPPGGSRDVIIVFNGNAGNRAYRADLARGFAANGFATLLFDYRGYGGNPGSPSEEGLVLDARAARRYLESRPGVDAQRIVYFGESLGSGVAVRLADQVKPRALVLRSPFTSLVDTARHHFGWLPVGLLLKDRFTSIDRIARIGCPLLVIAGDADTVIPIDQSRRLFAAAVEPKRLIVLESADHNDDALTAGPRVIAAVAELLGKK